MRLAKSVTRDHSWSFRVWQCWSMSSSLSWCQSRNILSLSLKVHLIKPLITMTRRLKVIKKSMWLILSQALEIYTKWLKISKAFKLSRKQRMKVKFQRKALVVSLANHFLIAIARKSTTKMDSTFVQQPKFGLQRSSKQRIVQLIMIWALRSMRICNWIWSQRKYSIRYHLMFRELLLKCLISMIRKDMASLV